MERTIQANLHKHSKVHLTLLQCAPSAISLPAILGVLPGALLYCSCSAPTGQCAQPTSPEYEFHVAKPTPDTLGRAIPTFRRVAGLYPKWPGSSNLGAVNGPFFLARPRWSKFSPLPAVAAALLLSIPLVKNTRGPVLAVLERAQHTLYLS
jgi:hypothetical protein